MSEHRTNCLGSIKPPIPSSQARHRRRLAVSVLRTTFVMLLLGLGFTFGCASLNLKSPTTWLATDNNTPQPPKSITAVWSPAVLERADGTRARGFGGRLMFYPKKGHVPTRVDGTLIVYAYDEQDRSPEETRPSRKYVITRQQLASHHSKSDLGDSYSVWIPWDQVDGSTKHVSLIARFCPAEGSAVVSSQAKVTLAGSNSSPIADYPPSSTPMADAPPSRSVQAASHEAPAQESDASPTKQQMLTTTINVPSRQKRR